MAERIDLLRADDPRDVVHRAVACLAGGGLVALPTGPDYGIVAPANRPAAVDRLRPLAGPGGPTLLIRSAGEVDDWAEVAGAGGRRLIRRAWPGHLAVVAPTRAGGLAGRLDPGVRAFLEPAGSLTLRVPSGRAAAEAQRFSAGPLVEVGPRSHADLDGLGDVDMILDAGPSRPGGTPTTVALVGDGWEVRSAGVVAEAEVAGLMPLVLLFVCTGNTCRSPMAEAICKALLARRLGCGVDELQSRGFVVLSAGLAASDGASAASEAMAVVREFGGALDGHSSQRAWPELIERADHVFAMTWDHLDEILAGVPAVADRARLIDPSGLDVDDPFGLDRATYLRTARALESHLTAVLDSLGL